MYKVNKAREELVKMYVDCLSEGIIPWEKGWTYSNVKQMNGVSKRAYNGMNAIILQSFAGRFGYEDNRWYTFNQINKMDRKAIEKAKKSGKKIGEKEHIYKVKKGQHGVKIEYWYLYNPKTRESMNLGAKEYDELDDEEKKQFIITSKCYGVWNASQIEGIKPQKAKMNTSVKIDKKLNDKINKVMELIGLKYSEIVGDQAYYAPAYDKVVLPRKEQFSSENEYFSTKLHEISHATGSEKRLNRKMSGSFGTPEYAKEELRAEIGSSFLMQSLGLKESEKNLDNHKAYIQSWISILTKKPSELFNAIKDAEKIEEYFMKYYEKADKEVEKTTSPAVVKKVKKSNTTKKVKNALEKALQRFIRYAEVQNKNDKYYYNDEFKKKEYPRFYNFDEKDYYVTPYYFMVTPHENEDIEKTSKNVYGRALESLGFKERKDLKKYKFLEFDTTLKSAETRISKKEELKPTTLLKIGDKYYPYQRVKNAHNFLKSENERVCFKELPMGDKLMYIESEKGTFGIMSIRYNKKDEKHIDFFKKVLNVQIQEVCR